MLAEVQKIYGNKVRSRACGILVKDERLLMINHKSLTAGDFWSPPGGGIEFGETAKSCLKREFLEETGLEIDVLDFLFVCEFIRPPLHAMELFFEVIQIGGNLRTGSDPEMKSDEQLIQETKFIPWREIRHEVQGSFHGVFGLVKEPSEIVRLYGYLTI
jgi:8-oxo-dGTP diphosphatase